MLTRQQAMARLLKKRIRSIFTAIIPSLLLVVSSQGRSTNELVTVVAQIEQARIIRLANEALTLSPPTITDHRATNSFGGPHDYYSQADYYWPNPKTRNGLPYVNRDGFSNTNNFQYHREALRDMKDAVAALAAAYALTTNDVYVLKAQELLRVFFLDEQTRMNPNLNYAQAIMGASKGSSLGIIDTLHLAELTVAIPFLEESPAFDPSVDAGLKQWFTDYLHWLTTSKNGKKEMKELNNHSVAYALQLACFARFVGDQTNFDRIRTRFEQVMLSQQMAADGSFRRELKRTKPYNYSVFQAENVATLCFLFSTPQSDVWTLKLPRGNTPLQSTEFIFPYLANKQKWLDDGRAMDVMHWEGWPVRETCLLFAYAEMGDARYFELWKNLNPDPTDLEIRRNNAITQPLLWIAQPAEAPLLGQ
jgi:hypothetical protein